MLNHREVVSNIIKNMQKYSPVLITGNSGMGKTYILKQIVNNVNDNNLKVFTSEEISDTLMDLIREAGNISEWKNNLLRQSILMIDDIDLIDSKEFVQRELLAVFKKYDKPIVITSLKPLKSYNFLEKFIAFFSQGTFVHLEPPTYQTQKEYVLNYINKNKIKFGSDVISWICQQVFSDYASMSGFIKTLELYYRLENQITVEKCRDLYATYR